MITKNSVVKIQNVVANHKSQPIKLNPDGHDIGQNSVETL